MTGPGQLSLTGTLNLTTLSAGPRAAHRHQPKRGPAPAPRQALSMGVHESQSLLWERMVALSPAFAEYLLPKVGLGGKGVWGLGGQGRMDYGPSRWGVGGWERGSNVLPHLLSHPFRARGPGSRAGWRARAQPRLGFAAWCGNPCGNHCGCTHCVHRRALKATPRIGTPQPPPDPEALPLLPGPAPQGPARRHQHHQGALPHPRRGRRGRRRARARLVVLWGLSGALKPAALGINSLGCSALRSHARGGGGQVQKRGTKALEPPKP